ncbi:hypothetical protein niasHT_034507 [Heterodera trifolii]|uniref:Cyclin C-terminal domain-containing protein n=1 Tax=Heterodera trifolii TaxID=157864 RepID=A0ABD2J2U9_9BILA
MLFVMLATKIAGAAPVTTVCRCLGTILNRHRVLSGLKFNLSVPYSMQFLRSYRFYASPSKSVWAFAKFISEIALVCYALAHFPPSVVAAVSLNLAAFAYGCPLPSPELFVNVFRMSEAAVERISRSFVDHVIQFLVGSVKGHDSVAVRSSTRMSVSNDRMPYSPREHLTGQITCTQHGVERCIRKMYRALDLGTRLALSNRFCVRKITEKSKFTFVYSWVIYQNNNNG